MREDGPRDAPNIVLLHGFACSIGWWDDMIPALARDHHVITFDLLGHGGSEKPREGYGMEEQARRVSAALDRLGVRRADDRRPLDGRRRGAPRWSSSAGRWSTRS